VAWNRLRNEMAPGSACKCTGVARTLWRRHARTYRDLGDSRTVGGVASGWAFGLLFVFPLLCILSLVKVILFRLPHPSTETTLRWDGASRRRGCGGREHARHYNCRRLGALTCAQPVGHALAELCWFLRGCFRGRMGGHKCKKQKIEKKKKKKNPIPASATRSAKRTF
jgi:hypothetical protein